MWRSTRRIFIGHGTRFLDNFMEGHGLRMWWKNSSHSNGLLRDYEKHITECYENCNHLMVFRYSNHSNDTTYVHLQTFCSFLFFKHYELIKIKPTTCIKTIAIRRRQLYFLTMQLHNFDFWGHTTEWHGSVKGCSCKSISVIPRNRETQNPETPLFRISTPTLDLPLISLVRIKH